VECVLFQEEKAIEYTPYFGDNDVSQDKLLGDLIDFEARQKAIDEGPFAVVQFRSRRFARFRTVVLDTFAEALRSGRLNDLEKYVDAASGGGGADDERLCGLSAASVGEMIMALMDVMQELAESVFSLSTNIEHITVEVCELSCRLSFHSH